MSMETLEFIIYPDGRVQETVTGIIGSSCAEVTAAIEEKLGRVTHSQQTADYFAQQNQSITQSDNSAATVSRWA